MLSLFKKKSNFQSDMSELNTDMHSHLIPGIDDGAEDMDMAIQMIRGMMDLGYRKLITTPHIQWDIYQNTAEIILTGCQAVKERLARDEIPVEFSAAAEYFIDDHFEDMLDSGERLLPLKNNLVLVEFSFIREPAELKDILFKLQIKGYQPVIAHPERYLYFGAQKTWYDQMKEMNCLFQLNLLSLCGYYGKKQEELAHYLIKKKYVDLLGSDLHSARHILIIKASSTIMDITKRLLDDNVLLNPGL
jgi:tyrosine-protein phosphatase YwqE